MHFLTIPIWQTWDLFWIELAGSNCADSSNRGKLDLKNQKAKYQITAPKGKVAQTNDVVLNLHYNVQPWVGVLTWTPQVDFGRWKKIKGGVSKKFKFPALKVKKVEDKRAKA